MPRNSLLLTVLAFLLLLKFVLLPLFDDFTEQKQALVLTSSQLERAQGVLSAAPAIEQAASDLQSRLPATLDPLLIGADDSAISLATQQLWQQVAQKRKVELDLFNWVEAVDLPGATFDSYQVREARVTMRLTGRLVSVALVLADLERRQGLELVKAESTAVDGLAYGNSSAMTTELRVLFRVQKHDIN